MKKFTDFGTVTKRHVSGMAETDKGHRFPASTDIGKGDQLVEVDGRKMFISKDEWTELQKQESGPKFQKGVTKTLIGEAAALGIDVDEATTKEYLIAAIEAAKESKAGDQ
ncbi:MAG: hypothetical protein AB7D34_01245 [Sulfurimonas sp.]